MINLARTMITNLFNKLGDLELPIDLQIEIADDTQMRKFQCYGWYCWIHINNVRYADCIDIEMDSMEQEEADSFIEDAQQIFKQCLKARQKFRAHDKKEIEILQKKIKELTDV